MILIKISFERIRAFSTEVIEEISFALLFIILLILLGSDILEVLIFSTITIKFFLDIFRWWARGGSNSGPTD